LASLIKKWELLPH